MMQLLSGFRVERYDTRREMGEKAAADVRAAIAEVLSRKDEVRMIFAAAPSQNEFLEALKNDPAIDFTRIVAFHMDEYVGLDGHAPQGFGNFLRDRLFGLVPFKAVHYLDGNASDIDAEIARYTALLREKPIDIVCMGIGENGHIAFNDPPVADFRDKAAVKVVRLDEICRTQQVHDGCFASLDLVPTHALTLTVPTLAAVGYHFCMVPAATKADAVYKTVYGPIGECCPATALRLCPHAVLYVDADSGKLLESF